MNQSTFSWGSSSRKKAIEAIGLFVGFYALNFLLMRYLPHWSLIEQLGIPYISDFIMTVIDGSTLLLLLYVMKKRQFDLSDKTLQKGLRTLIIVGIVAFLLISMSDYLLERTVPVPPLGSLPFEDRITTFFIEFIIAIISGPIFEEVLFRGLLLKYVFADKPFIGMLVSSLLFIWAHPSADWTAYWYYGIPGIILGLAYNYTKSIKVPVAVHMALNLVSHIKTNLL